METEEPGQELEVAISANEFLDQMDSVLTNRIIEGAAKLEKERHEDKMEKKIAEHYEYLARTKLEELWKKCRKATGHHRIVVAQNYHNVYQCEFCAMPMTDSNDNGEIRLRKEGITEIARQLRELDKKAGIEWKP